MPTEATIRPINSAEFDLVGELCVNAYVNAGFIEPGDPYVATLRGTERRVKANLAEVVVATVGDEVVGTVTLAPFGSDLTIVCHPGEVEPRVLAVAANRARLGIGRQLVEFTEQWARDHGLHTVVVCVANGNQAAFEMYVRHGFIHDEDRDWVEPGGALLRTLTKSVASSRGTFCARCGGERNSGDHQSCWLALDLEPPRYCTECKRRMIVQVTPTGWAARCKEHGIQNS